MSSASTFEPTQGYAKQGDMNTMNTQASINMSLYAGRKRTNLIGLFLSMSAMALGLVFLLWILLILFLKQRQTTSR